MSIEKKWAAVAPKLFTVDGNVYGIVSVADTAGIKVKQRIVISASTLPNLQLQVKRVISSTQFIVGAFPTKVGESLLSVRADLSAYTVALGAYVYAEEQDKSNLKSDDIWQAVYEQEPTVAIRSTVVDKYGNFWDASNPLPSLAEFIRNGVSQAVTEDTVTPSNNRPLPVKLTGLDGDVIINANNLNLEVQLEGKYDSVNNPKPDSVGTVSHERGAVQDQTKQTQRTTAKRGTVDTDTVSQDISLHDQDGNSYTQSNPVPITNQFEKFFPIIAASKWMELAVFDEIIPTYSNGNTTLTLAYKEDGALLGEAVMNLTSSLVWDMKLNRYINDDDGTQLLNDDGIALNLD